MPPYIITCPACKQRYKANKLPLMDQPFVCKKCGYTASIGGLLNKQSEPQPVTQSGDAVPGAAPAGVKKTKVRAGANLEVKAYLTVAGNGTKYVLTPGIYILGRQSSDSMASLQLAPDISMSRKHARLAVQKVGGKVMAQIIGLKAENPIIVNDRILPAGQPYTLKPGDSLQFGATRVIYSI